MSRVKLVDTSGQNKGNLDLGIDLGSFDIKPKTYSCAIRVLLQNWRQGTVKCKSRGEVRCSGRKPWRQKGTGRARAGTASSPIWRKGGVAFGPTPRVKSFKMNRRGKRQTLKGWFKFAVESGNIFVLEDQLSEKKTPKTKDAFNLIKGIGLKDKKGVLFVAYDDAITCASFRNIPSVLVISFDQPNVFDLSDANYWMFFKKDVDLFKDMVKKWI